MNRRTIYIVKFWVENDEECGDPHGRVRYDVIVENFEKRIDAEKYFRKLSQVGFHENRRIDRAEFRSQTVTLLGKFNWLDRLRKKK